MKAKSAIVSVFALVLAAAAVCGEQYRLRTEAAKSDDPTLEVIHVAAQEVDVTN
jgi:ABC-type glycerol-3-phosphate transport system substrate-binding protein